MKEQRGIKRVAQNRTARRDYDIQETYEAGLVLQGTEVKALREGRVNIKDGYARIRNGELFLEDVHISPYAYGNRLNHEPLRERKLLMRRREINRLIGKVHERGYTLIPLDIHFARGRAKVELALAKGKKLHDKRETLRRRDMEKELERAYTRNRRLR
jgi:SsrA-binding protein